MNRDVILFHLREAAEALDKTVIDVESDTSCSEEDFETAMGHLYHHLNTAWNGRHQSLAQFEKGQDFDRLRKFPNESEFRYLSVSVSD